MVALGLSDEQLATRRKGLGGSDMAAVLGLDPYRGPFDVWAEKTGRAQPMASNRFTRWGNILEGVIASEYAERNGVALIGSSTVMHPRRPWQVGTPDRLVYERPDVPDRGLEIKARGLRQAWKWGTESEGAAGVPDEVACQCDWYLSLTELPRWDVAVLLDGNDYREYKLERDGDIEGAMRDAGERFWRDHVLADKPPAFDGGNAVWSYLRERLAGSEKRSVEPSPQVEALALELEATIRTITHAEKQKQVLRQKLTDLCAGLGVRGFASDMWNFGVVEQRGRVNWKTLAEVVLNEVGYSAQKRAQLEEACRGRSFVAPRFTSQRLKEEKEE